MAGAVVFLPGLAAFLALALYIGPNVLPLGPFGDELRLGRDSARPFVYGTLGAIALWLVLSPLLLRRYTQADRANPSAYAQLVEVYRGLAARADAAGPATAELAAHLTHAARELGYDPSDPRPGVGLRWVTQAAYIDVWRTLHRAEELLLQERHERELVGEAVFDDLRLSGSKMAQADELRRKLRTAATAVQPDSLSYLGRVIGGEPVPDQSGGAEPTQHARDSARAVLRTIRRSINEFRDDSRDGLVRARNNLYATVFVAGVTAHAFLGVIMLSNGIEDHHALAGASFYFVGALVGLFRQLRVASGADRVTEEDYGLYLARLIHVPLFSGLAGVAGVALTALVPAVVQVAEADASTLQALGAIFDVERSPASLALAATFGLAPALLISTLQQRAEKYKDDLKTTEPGERRTDERRD